MSYDINFWKQPAGFSLSPEQTYARLCNAEPVEELLDLPVDEILTELKKVLPDFDPSESFPLAHTASQEKNQDGSVEVAWSSKHFRFDLRGETTDAFNELVALMTRFGCPLYDPQEDKRYASDDGTLPVEVPRQEPLTDEQKAEIQRILNEFLAKMSGASPQKRGCGSQAAMLLVFLGTLVWLLK